MARDRLASMRAGGQSQNRYILPRSPKEASDIDDYPTHSERRSLPIQVRDRGVTALSRPPVAHVQLTDRQLHDARLGYFEFEVEDSEARAARWSHPLQIRKKSSQSSEDSMKAVAPYPFTGYGPNDTANYNRRDSLAQSDITLNTINSSNDMTSFYSEITVIQESLKTFNNNVAQISDLHARSLNSMDWATSRRSDHQIDILMRCTGRLGENIKLRIKDICAVRDEGRNAQIRNQQTALMKHKFILAIHNYQQIEKQYRTKYKQRLEKQFLIVNPDATPEEVKEIVEGSPDEQLFSKMLQSSNRYGESRAALREVKDRHDDIKKIEKNLTELSELFNEMDMLVMKDGETLEGIHTMSADVEKSAENGLMHAKKAVDAARSYRRKQWICVGICVAIIVAFVIVVTIMAVFMSIN